MHPKTEKRIDASTNSAAMPANEIASTDSNGRGHGTGKQAAARRRIIRIGMVLL